MNFTTTIDIQINNDEWADKLLVPSSSMSLINLYNSGLFISWISEMPAEFLGEEVTSCYVGLSGLGHPFYLKKLRRTGNGIWCQCWCEFGVQEMPPAETVELSLIPATYRPVTDIGESGDFQQGKGRYGDWIFATEYEEIQLALRDIRAGGA